MKNRFIDVEKVKKYLHYNPDTGVFTKLTSDARGRFPRGFQYKPKKWDSYGRIAVNGVSYAAHRLAWVYMTGNQPNIIDHINGLRHDNRFANLRDGSFSDNSRNRKEHRVRNGTYVPTPENI